MNNTSGKSIWPEENRVITSSTFQLPSNRNLLQRPQEYQKKPYKEVVRYMECLKNHAAAIGGNSTDGCGEFMASGEEGSLEAFNCKACDCHRNFHRKVIHNGDDCHHSSIFRDIPEATRLILGHPNGIIIGSSHYGYPSSSLISSKEKTSQKIVFQKSCSLVSSESEETKDGDDNGGGMVGIQRVKKRLRTKFTEAQKEKMMRFAEKAGWKMQKLEESVVEGFCQEIGIKRRVLQVWMYNNKHNFAKKSL